MNLFCSIFKKLQKGTKEYRCKVAKTKRIRSTHNKRLREKENIFFSEQKAKR